MRKADRLAVGILQTKMPKKKLLMILGAGSSVAQNLPSVDEIDCMMKNWAKAMVAGPKTVYTQSSAGSFITTRPAAGKPDYFKLAWENREGYYSSTPAFMEDVSRTNYERVLGDMHCLLNGFIEQPNGDPILHLLNRAIDPTVERDFDSVGFEIKTLCIQLAQYVRDKSVCFEKAKAGHIAFQNYCQLLAALAREFDLGVYTLNYDTVALTALPGFFTGFDPTLNPSPFQSHEVYQRRDWSFLYHLHGSVHHHTVPPGDRPSERKYPGEILWESDLKKCLYDRGSLRIATDHRRMVPTALVTGGWKLDQIQEDPFQTFYSTLPRHLSEADAILIGGYGFGDAHVNAILESVMLNPRITRPPVVVLGHTSVPRNLELSLIGNGIGWTEGGPNPQDTKFKVPVRYPNYLPNRILVWLGGFENAGTVLSDIFTWLGM
jgi:hypothetical protein